MWTATAEIMRDLGDFSYGICCGAWLSPWSWAEALRVIPHEAPSWTRGGNLMTGEVDYAEVG